MQCICSSHRTQPELLLNYKRKSTQGWSIENVALDFTGGTLSILQLFLDSYLDRPDAPFVGVKGDLPKLGLGLLAIGFNVAFFVQHALWRHNKPGERVEGEAQRETDPLLA